VALVVGLTLLALLALMIWGIGKRAAGTVGSVPVASRPAPLFSLPLFDGGQFDLAAARGKPVLINFWASWCIPCEEEAAVLEQGSRAYRDRVVFVGVNVQDTEPLARDFLRRFGVTYPNGRDASGAIAVDYGMSGVPETYFVDRDGRIARKWQGALDEARLRTFLDELLR
jgi:cytochrome c biogenesis protein CcmG/thiol:disulfide interchange protein DsbE